MHYFVLEMSYSFRFGLQKHVTFDKRKTEEKTCTGKM